MTLAQGRRLGVVLLSQLFYPELVSTGQTLTELAEELAALGVEATVICAQPTVVGRGSKVPRSLEHQGIRIERVWSTRFPKLSLPGRILNALTFAASTVIRALFAGGTAPTLVVTNPPFLVLAALARKLVRRRPYIFLVFDVYPDIAVLDGVLRENGFLHRAWDALNRVAYWNADAVIVLGSCMREVVRREDKLGPACDDRLHMVHVWADDRHIAPMPVGASPYIGEWGLDGRFVVQYSGNMGRIHDMESIMQAALLLRHEDDIHFLFVGEGHKKAAMQEFASAHSLGNCTFKTYVPRERLSDLLGAADVSLVTLESRYTGLAVPSKLYAAMASGRPVVGVMDANGEAAWVIQQEECGLVVPCGDPEALARSIVYLRDHPEDRAVMGRRARQAIDNRYSLRHAAERYREIIVAVSS